MAAVVLGFDPSAPTTAQAAGGATVMIPADNYVPVATVIAAGQSVTWVNKDSDKHAAISVPGVPQSFSVTINPGKSVSHTFTKPGVYPYYDWTHATFDSKLRRVVARKGTDTYPVAMEGLIVVKGPGFSGAPAESITISGSSFSPDIAVIAAGGKVTWTNADTEAHAVVTTDGQKLPLPTGKSQTNTFAKPGVYTFYCERHATYDTKLGLAKAKAGAKTFPVSMQGFVVVL
jgi:plastocyanin